MNKSINGLPGHNVFEYLKEYLDDTINQTLYDIEIISVCDGLTDSLGKIPHNCVQENKGYS